MNNYLAVSLGILCAGVGGELFVRGAVGIGHWLRVPIGLIGVTIAAFATSSPEMAVALTAASAGTPQIALGDALGSNVVNISLILALALLITPIAASFATLRRDFGVALLTPLVIALLAFDGRLSRIDGLLLLAIFGGWLALVVQEARTHRTAAPALVEEQARGKPLLLTIIGLLFLIAAGRFIVTGAKGIAVAHGIDPFIIGATIVAVATGTPELAMTLIALLRKQDHLGLGNILGSNIFNGLFVVALAAIISPITIPWDEVAIGLLWGVVTTLIIIPFYGAVIGRQRGLLLLLLYLLYVILLLQP
jgi:cation:H+ antiporter